MRAFIAISLPAPVRQQLAGLRESLPFGRPVPEENLHLTLAFLDDQPESLLRDLHEQLSLIRAEPFELSLSGLGIFGGPKPRVLFAEVEESGPLRSLHREVKGAVRRVDLTLPRERFRPHVTLARLPGQLSPLRARQLQLYLENHIGAPLPGFRVEDFTLFHSILGRDGARHEELATYPLLRDPAEG